MTRATVSPVEVRRPLVAPREAIDARNELVDWFRRPIAQQFFSAQWDGDILARVMTARQFVAEAPEVIGPAPVTFVSPHMTTVCAAAARSFPGFVDFSPADLPSPTGLLVWGGEPILTYESVNPARAGEVIDLLAIGWKAEEQGCILTKYEDRDGGTIPEGISRSAIRRTVPRLVDIGRWASRWGENVIEGPDADGSPNSSLIAKAFHATVALMGQMIAATEPQRLSRAENRACQRVGCATDLSVVRLRRLRDAGPVSGWRRT
jgi:hypothetical protein